MGNLCGKESSDNFHGQGRPLSSAPPQPQSASVPKKRINEPPRTLGGSSSSPGSSNAADAADARRKAAEAAEARANGAKKKAGTGKLAGQLEAQKKQTRKETLNEASRIERLQRDADAAAAARVHN